MIAHRPRKRFGQHFLHDPGILQRIVDVLHPHPADHFVEIGPGTGVLTRRLLDRLERLEAIEIDRDLVAGLRADFDPERLAIHQADALRFDYSAFPVGTRIVGNLPYNISTPLLFRLAQSADRWRDLHFMLQREVVDRIVAHHSSPAYGRLSVMLQLRFQVERLFRVPSGAFRPPPKVESAIVRLVPLVASAREGIDFDAVSRLVARGFSARRKKLRNALALPVSLFESLDVDPDLRPENLSPETYLRIARALAAIDPASPEP